MSNTRLFKILIITDSSEKWSLGSWIPEDSNFAINTLTLTTVSEERPADIDLFLFAIGPTGIDQCIKIIHKWKISTTAATVGANLYANQVVSLMKSGFSEVFDRDRDQSLFQEWFANYYEEEFLSTLQPEKSEKRSRGTQILGSSAEMQNIRQLANQAATYSDLTVLIQGETGTGKEMVARLIHESSPRQNNPFIEVNCSAIPETLMEAEMLGYEKGAFTDARRSRRGFFELADKGTLFLDEIGVMSPALQNKILKIVEEKKFRRLGGEKEISVDVKIIAGTNEDLIKATEEGRFRPDLYYRLKVFSIQIPALRERVNDIALLAGFFLKQVNERYDLSVSGFHPVTAQLLAQYSWPGNVRELKHIVERACVLATRGRVLPRHLPDEFQNLEKADLQTELSQLNHDQMLCIPLPEEGIPMARLERLIMTEILRRNNGNQSKTARYLRISRTRLARKMAEED